MCELPWSDVLVQVLISFALLDVCYQVSYNLSGFWVCLLFLSSPSMSFIRLQVLFTMLLFPHWVGSCFIVMYKLEYIMWCFCPGVIHAEIIWKVVSLILGSKLLDLCILYVLLFFYCLKKFFEIVILYFKKYFRVLRYWEFWKPELNPLSTTAFVLVLKCIVLFGLGSD